MMHHARIAGHDLDTLNPGVMRKYIRQNHIAVRNVACRRELLRLSSTDDQVRFANQPLAIRKLGRPRRSREVAPSFSAARPLHNRLAFLQTEAPIIDEFPEPRMRKPRRHPLLLDYFRDGV